MSKIDLIKDFIDPVNDSQFTFRQLLKAMSEPGILSKLTTTEPLGFMSEALFATCQTLLDQQTSIWLSKEFDTPDIRHNLSFHTGAPILDDATKAQFAIAFAWEIQSTENFHKGDVEYPETACTLLLQVNALNGDDGDTLKLSGPGIETDVYVRISDLTPAILTYLTTRPDHFPLGLDLILTAEDALLCIPRSTLVEVC